MPLFVLLSTMLFTISACRRPRIQATTPQPVNPVYEATLANDDDKVIQEWREESLIIVIDSKAGIGSAEFSTSQHIYPERLVFQLHLEGLEELRLEYGAQNIRASVNSTSPHHLTESLLREDGSEESLSPSSPYWMEIRIISNGPDPVSLPLKSAYFEVEASANFLEDPPREFTVHWIDFYR